MYPPWLSWYLLILVLLILPLDLIASLPGMLTKSAVLSCPQFLEKGSDAILTVTSVSSKIFPAGGINVKLRVVGDDFSVNYRILTTSEAGNKSEIIIDTSYTGLTVFTIKRASTISLVGLFSIPISVTGSASVLILPPPLTPAGKVHLPRSPALQAKPGGGFAEDHDIRSYRHGDPVRSIHWKLSAKLNSLIIREPLIPPPHTRLIHLFRWNNASERDIAFGRLRWVSKYLLDRDMAYYIKFADIEYIAEITSEAELIFFLCKALDSSPAIDRASLELPTRFSWIYNIDGKEASI